VPKEIQAIVDAPDRTPTDRALDAGRHPAETLAFFGVKPGWRVAELEPGGGYTTELLARAVGPSGKVYGMNSKVVLERFAEKPWAARLTRPACANVVRVDHEIDEPFPAEAKNLDAVFLVLFYHDTVWMNADRDKMNRAVFDALAPGGLYAIVDHTAAPGAGTTVAKTLHRIEEKVVKEEILRAGFRLAAEGDFLANPGDTRDWNDAPSAAADKRGTSDRFVLAFTKPAAPR
jgi:predicted methyltransferase